MHPNDPGQLPLRHHPLRGTARRGFADSRRPRLGWFSGRGHLDASGQLGWRMSSPLTRGCRFLTSRALESWLWRSSVMGWSRRVRWWRDHGFCNHARRAILKLPMSCFRAWPGAGGADLPGWPIGADPGQHARPGGSLSRAHARDARKWPENGTRSTCSPAQALRRPPAAAVGEPAPWGFQSVSRGSGPDSALVHGCARATNLERR
jgi:hypothetical protein